MFSDGLLHINILVLADQQGTYVHKLFVDMGCSLEKLPGETDDWTDDARESGNSML